VPSQPSLNRLVRFGLRPNRELGQHFLIDSNLLGVIERAAELSQDDVVLEIGGGVGVLSEHLAARVAHVHVVEVDRALEPALRDALDPHPNASLHFADALGLDLGALAPAPVKVVANLPYGIATNAVLRTVSELPGCRLWVAMVQREAGERLAASAGTSAYGTPSVLAQMECEVAVLRSVSRTVFHPVPNVDSVLVRLRRRAGGEPVGDGVRDLVHAAFAHRRKALARSLSLAPGAVPGVRERAREALEAMGHPADQRAERLSPDEFRELHRRIGRR
jgi:16S rRNA (adenine1518-N6/adenine1519-N6)-dimethyltransferase